MARTGKVSAAIRQLSAGGANTRCSDMNRILSGLGFRIENGSRGNHRTFHHDEIDKFLGGNYDCGHGRDAQLKKRYVEQVAKVVIEFEDDLRTILGEENE